MSWRSKFTRQSIAIAATTIFAALIVSCSGDDRSSRESIQKSPEKASGSLSGKIHDSNHSTAEKPRFTATESPFEADPGQAEVRDDEAAELREESDSEEYDEYDYVEEQPASTVSLRERSEGYVEWQTPSEVAYSNAEVVVVGPDGKRTQHSFGPGEAMMLDESLPDGLYLWESVITPEVDDATRQQMRSVRESGDQQAQQELLQSLRANGSLPTEAQAKDNRQSGAFVVRDGVASPTSSKVESKDDGA